MSRIDGQSGLGGVKPLRNLDAASGSPQEPDAPQGQAATSTDSTQLTAGASQAAPSLSDLVSKAKEAAAQPPAHEHHEGLLGRLWDGVKHEASAAEHAVGDAVDTLGSLGKSLKIQNTKIQNAKILGAAEAAVTPGGLSSLFHKAIQGIEKAVTGTSKTEFKTRQIENDPSDVNNPSADDVDQAESDLAANAAAERAALAKLSPEDQAKYRAIVSQVSNLTMPCREMQKMLLDGRLPGAKDLTGQGTLLDQLNTLATEKLADGVDRKQLLNDVIGEVEDPVRIDQQAKGTCGATTAQILLTRKHPAEYVRLISGLAAPEGQAKMIGGDTLKRVSDWNNNNDGGRSVSSRLIQPALMNEADGVFPGVRYNNSADKNKELFIPVGSGMADSGSAKINSQLEGVHFSNHGMWRWDRDSHWNMLNDALTHGKGPIPVSMQFNDDGKPGGHFVQVDKIENGRVYYTNPWGQQESLSEDEFKSHCTGMQIPDHAL